MNISATKTLHPAISFLGIIVIFQAVGGLIGWMTASGVDGWYQDLQRSPLTPPDAAFGIVWTALYVLLAIAFWTVWRKPPSRDRDRTVFLFGAHMILNWLWNPLFFIAHALYAAFALILILIFTAAMLAWMIYPQSRLAALVFIPYLGWLTFAGHLSHYIWMKN